MWESVCFSLLYTTLKVEENKQANEAQDHNSKDGEQCSNNEVSTLNDMPISQGKDMALINMNMYTLQDLETTSIPYKDNQPVELNSWNKEAYPISIFGTVKFLDIDSKNILTLLLWMANFISNRKIKNNMKKYIPQLEGFD